MYFLHIFLGTLHVKQSETLYVSANILEYIRIYFITCYTCTIDCHNQI